MDRTHLHKTTVLLAGIAAAGLAADVAVTDLRLPLPGDVTLRATLAAHRCPAVAIARGGSCPDATIVPAQRSAVLLNEPLVPARFTDVKAVNAPAFVGTRGLRARVVRAILHTRPRVGRAMLRLPHTGDVTLRIAAATSWSR